MAGGSGRGTFVLLIVVASATLAVAPTARGADTTDGTSGSPSGHTTFRFPHQHAEAGDVAVQPSGEIVIAGTAYTKESSRFALVRLLSDGRLDPSFGNGGRVTTDFGARSALVALSLQPDGKILAAGYVGGSSNAGRSDFLIARYLPGGRVDPGFGSGGRVMLDFGGNDLATSLGVQTDGKVVVGGATDRGYPDNENPDSRLALARLDPDGSLDSEFGAGGTTSVELGGYNFGYAVATMPDDSIAIAGSHTADPGALPQDSLAIARYESNGSLDPEFGDAGTLIRALTTRHESRRVRDVQPWLGTVEFAADGSIVAATEVAIHTRRGLKYEAWIARFAPDGHPDPSFAGDGYAWVGERTLFTPNAISIQADGSLYLSGYRFGRRDMSLGLTHLRAGGGLDRAFGRRGQARIPFRGVSSYAGALATDETGRIIVAGSAIGTFSNHTGLPIKPARMAIARYTADGRLDHSFGARRRARRGRYRIQRIAPEVGERATWVAASPCRVGCRTAPRRPR